MSLIDTYPDTLAAMNTHLSTSDPYTVAWGNMRAGLYEVYYIPHSVHDGLYDADPYQTYETKFLDRQAIPTDVTIDMSVTGGGDTWDVSLQVCIETGGVGKTMKIWVAQLLDNHVIAPEDPVRNALRAGNAGVEITLAADECMEVTEVFVLDAPSLSSPDNVKFVAWAQDPVFVWAPHPTPPPAGYSWAEIFQGAKAVAPFEGVFIDGFEAGDALRWGQVSP